MIPSRLFMKNPAEKQGEELKKKYPLFLDSTKISGNGFENGLPQKKQENLG